MNLDIKKRLKSFSDADMKLSLVLDCWCNHWFIEVGDGCSSTGAKGTPKYTKMFGEQKEAAPYGVQQA